MKAKDDADDDSHQNNDLVVAVVKDREEKTIIYSISSRTKSSDGEDNSIVADIINEKNKENDESNSIKDNNSNVDESIRSRGETIGIEERDSSIINGRRILKKQ